MFDVSGYRKGEAGKPVNVPGDSVKPPELFNQSINCCPSILTGISREMRTEMNAIVAFTFLLSKGEYRNDENDELNRHIFSSCDKIISLLDNFLDFAIIDTGNSIPESRSCNPNEVLHDLFSEFREVLRHKEYNDLIFVSESQSINNSQYMLDMTRITRVIRNLFQIALSNTTSGYIKTGFGLRNECLTFYILDSGKGFSKCSEFLQSRDMEQSLKKYNDVFTAVSIALVRKLIQSMKGSMRIECNGLSGSGIYFSVPARISVETDNIINKYSNTMSTI
jgi:K+-sensing histidine kinase KdpD